MNFPGHYLHHTDRRMRISPADVADETFRKDASFSGRLRLSFLFCYSDVGREALFVCFESFVQ